eukprot:PhM_4_TR9640/c0_g1_i1/m.19259
MRPFTLRPSTSSWAFATSANGITCCTSGRILCSVKNSKHVSRFLILIESDPMMLMLLRMQYPSGRLYVPFETLPTSTRRPPGATQRILASIVGAPTHSRTIPNAWLRFLCCLLKGFDASSATTTSSAPSLRMYSALSLLVVTAVTRQPRALHIKIDAVPRPPEAPVTSTDSPFVRPPRTTAPSHIVPKVDITGAASMAVHLSFTCVGSAQNAVASFVTYSPYPPSHVRPHMVSTAPPTRSGEGQAWRWAQCIETTFVPGDIPCFIASSPASTTTPLNSCPRTVGRWIKGKAPLASRTSR